MLFRSHLRGRPQQVLSTAHKLDRATALFREVAPILEAQFAAKITWAYGRMRADLPDGSSWTVAAATESNAHGSSNDLIVVDDDRMRWLPGEWPEMRTVRFRTMGCWPVTGAVESTATTLPEIIHEMLTTRVSERQGRAIDRDVAGAMEKLGQVT